MNKDNILLQAEKNILSVCMNSEIGAIEVFDVLKPHYFNSVEHQVIYRILYENQKKLKPDITIILSYFNKNNLDNVGGMKTILAIFNEYISNEHIEEWIAIIVNHYRETRLIQLINKTNKEISDQKPINNILNNLELDLLNIKDESQQYVFTGTNSIIKDVIEKINQLNISNDSLTGVSSGFSNIDNITFGFQKGDFIVLAARPSMGKTALSLNFALNAAIDQPENTVAIFSLEMPKEQLVQRMLGSLSTVDGNKIRSGKGILKKDWNLLYKASDQITKFNIMIDDTPGLNIQDLQTKIRKLSRQKPLSLIIIDYLQLLTIANKRVESRQQEIATISRILKAIARELKVPIICLSQLSRSVEKREVKKPIMSDLRDSGAIEQDADMIMFLYRSNYYQNNQNNEGEPINNNAAELNIAKHRNGPTGIVNLYFDAQTGTFDDHEENNINYNDNLI